MPFFEDLTKGNVMAGVGVGMLALALPLLVPALRSPMRMALKAGLKLFLESEFELDGEVIDELVSAAVTGLGAVIARPGWRVEDRQEAQALVKRFKAKARARAHRWGADDRDRAARYRRHLAKLQHAVSQAQSRVPDAVKPQWAEVAGIITEDW